MRVVLRFKPKYVNGQLLNCTKKWNRRFQKWWQTKWCCHCHLMWHFFYFTVVLLSVKMQLEARAGAAVVRNDALWRNKSSVSNSHTVPQWHPCRLCRDCLITVWVCAWLSFHLVAADTEPDAWAGTNYPDGPDKLFHHSQLAALCRCLVRRVFAPSCF